MLLIHYVSIMMWIFYIDGQQYWKCDWTMNVGANLNAHGKQTVSTKQPQVTDLTVEHPDIGEVLSYFFFFLGGVGGGGGWGGISSNALMHLLFGAVYQSQGRRGYLDISNVALIPIPCSRVWAVMYILWIILNKRDSVVIGPYCLTGVNFTNSSPFY